MSLKLPKEFNNYKPKITLRIDKGNFIVKTAESKEELIGAFHLRHNVFYKERKKEKGPPQLKIDDFDIYGDQMIVINKKNNQVVGAFRLILAESEKDFKNFSLREYWNIDAFIKKLKGNITEMEWACMDKSIRDTQAVYYLWLGMVRYFRLTQSRYLFGMVSILNSSAEECANFYKTFFEQKITQYKIDEKPSVYPNPAYTIKNFDTLFSKACVDKKYLLKVSRLFSWYLKMGAKTPGPPIFDSHFDAYAFFLTVEFKKITQSAMFKSFEDAVYLRNMWD